MNVHHLELFYFVARHGGIAPAVRKIPYGIQQPAVSAQMAKLEESLGVTLFQRRPFALTPAGAELFEFIEPFFGNLGEMARKLGASASPQLRIAAPALVMHDYIPDLLQRLRARFPKFRLLLHEAARDEADELLLAGEIDLAITLIEKKPRKGMQSMPLIDLNLVLLVPKKSPITSAGELWGRDKIEETLITFPRTDAVQNHFQRGLQRLGIEWYCGIEMNSARLIERYVAKGYGIGLSVAQPGFKPAAGVRAVPLEDFEPMTIGAVWSGALPPLARQFLSELESEAKAIGNGDVTPLECAG